MADKELDGLTLTYDKVADVLHVSCGLSEPYYCENVDDIIMVKRGMETNIAIGFEVLDVKHHGPKKIDSLLKRVLDREAKRDTARMQWYQALVEKMRGRNIEDLAPA